MRFTFTDEQRAFQRGVRDFLAKECPPEHVRAMASDPTGRSPTLWKGLAELGVVGLTVPEEFGGLGGNEIDLVLILEEAGRAALPEPLLENTAVAVPLACEFIRSKADLAQMLPRVASGDSIITVAGFGGGTVADGHIAELVLLPTGTSLGVVQASELELRLKQSIDATRRLFTHDWGAPSAEPYEGPAFEAAFDRGAFGAAAILCGIANVEIDMAAAYAKERKQFGVPIGSFQAVKHLLADALLGLEFARPVVYKAAWSIATGSPDRTRDASMAKAYASDAAMNAGRAALQVHGAIGYTHEHDLHLWLNKGTALAHAWGTAAFHRERIARILLG
jgi:alkylation response protein AidB-like acyl-CoA dehydrogenase